MTRVQPVVPVKAAPYPDDVGPDVLVWVLPAPGGVQLHRYLPGEPAAPCGAATEGGSTAAAAEALRDFGPVTWCLACFTDPPAPSTVDRLMCGCPYPQYQAGGHRDGCWMATAETIAVEAYLAAESGTELAGLLDALAEAGYLRVPDSDGELLSLLDALAEAELLGPPPAGGEAT